MFYAPFFYMPQAGCYDKFGVTFFHLTIKKKPRQSAGLQM
jgi:hypothetical protein